MSVIIDPELRDQIKDLMDRGFKAAWMGDLQVGDIFAGPRHFTFDPPRKLFVVEQVNDTGPREHHVMNMIVTDEDGLERHLAYGITHEIYIWRGEA